MSFYKVPLSFVGITTVTVWSLVHSILLCKDTVWLLMLISTLAIHLVLTKQPSHAAANWLSMQSSITVTYYSMDLLALLSYSLSLSEAFKQNADHNLALYSARSQKL